ncbi:MAG: hypothetical protein GY711_18415 [bacterium]|nr:hypothetical protein [bacterium]
MRRAIHEQLFLRACASTALGAILAQASSAQVSFSIDNGSVSVGGAEAWSPFPVTEADILTPSMPGPAGPNAPMFAAPTPTGITLSAPSLGLFTHGACAGHAGGTPCPIELDALSYGTDYAVTPTHTSPDTYWFSVDEFATGFPGPVAPSVFTEGFTGALEAAADVFTDIGVSPAPAPPGMFPGGNVAEIDGDGLLSASGFVYPGVGLIEPIPAPTAAPVGDDLDAVDVDSASLSFPVYYSLDSAFPTLQGTAAVYGFSGGDVLMTTVAGGAPAVYAPAGALGLDLLGFDSDDLDALALTENGVPGFQPAFGPYTWLGGPAGPGADMLLFSVRRGSAVIGMPDSMFGFPIEEGDILSTPIPTAMGGLSPFPSIWIAAENIGLTTVRSGLAHIGDELDALDVLCYDCPSAPDCNENGVPDDIDITSGTSTDVNGNGIPDECELISTSFCFCVAALAPCGNDYAAGGCENATGVGAILTATGTGSVVADDLLLGVTQATPANFGLIFMGPSMIAPTPMGNGLRCVGGGLHRYIPPFITDAAGAATVGPMVGLSLGLPPAGNIVALSTWSFQAWYRDPGGPCGATSNVTNAVSVTFTP